MALDYTRMMGHYLDRFSTMDSKHGREYMTFLLDEIVAGRETEENTERLVKELILFEKIRDEREVRALLSKQPVDRSGIEKIICSGDECLDMGKQVLRGLYDRKNSYPSSADFIRRVVYECMDPDLDPEDPVRLLIVKQFLKSGYKDKYIPCEDYRELKDDIFENATALIDRKTFDRLISGKEIADPEDLFRRFTGDREDRKSFSKEEKALYDKWNKGPRKDALKEYRNNSILSLAKDLTEGIIKANNATREKLLMFGIAFHMKCSYETEEAERYGVRDINNSLFGDYYSYLAIRDAIDHSGDTGIAQDEKAIDYSSVASGINYKNPVDVIYSFYMNNEEMEVSRKWDRIRHMKKKVNQEVREASADDREDTLFYKDELRALGNDEDLLQSYISNFRLYTSLSGSYNRNAEILSGRQCYEQLYDELISEVEHRNRLSEEMRKLSGQGTGLSRKTMERLVEGDTQFLSFLDEFRDRMLSVPMDLEMTLVDIALSGFGKTEDVPEEKLQERLQEVDISRYEMIRLLYYKFVMENNGVGLDFPETFHMFAAYVEESLMYTRYQGINAKNMFDVLVAIAIYINSNTRGQVRL